MNSIVERLHMLGDDLSSERFTVRDTSLRAADLIEQQAERIKELEAKCDYWRDHYKGLRQRIADAPVVAWVIRNAECDLKGWIPAKVWADGELQYPLISKEDLQK